MEASSSHRNMGQGAGSRLGPVDRHVAMVDPLFTSCQAAPFPSIVSIFIAAVGVGVTLVEMCPQTKLLFQARNPDCHRATFLRFWNDPRPIRQCSRRASKGQCLIITAGRGIRFVII